MHDLVRQVQAGTAKLVSLDGRAERLNSELADGRRVLADREVDLVRARIEGEHDRETIEQLRGEVDRRERTLSVVRHELAQIRSAVEGT
jgi:hypothetical protein